MFSAKGLVRPPRLPDAAASPIQTPRKERGVRDHGPVHSVDGELGFGCTGCATTTGIQTKAAASFEIARYQALQCCPTDELISTKFRILSGGDIKWLTCTLKPD